MNMLRFNRPVLSAVAAVVLAAGWSTAHAELPPVQQQGNVQFVSGGIGLNESESMKAAEKDYPLALVFAQQMDGQNAYAADVPVTITDSKGATVLRTTTNGPYLLVRLPAGQYRITSTFNGKELVRQATVGGPGSHTRAVFEWK
ncbi:carboxypeptidase-like regulatory domain-containing protein [Bordetella flabilis]|uniref:Carboxypeptidase regulatory-like domain-containing protein n=1 Tax=Bordetella flabilis TaxID=463014 RepID=A0A193GED1_9BORD|nr:carboxypeptidase-like regulatory domain-containing protein [Bordetella flabilis]ANN78397.1 hypothetical protein BAU07_15915 [Bordetella flabilis]